MAPDGAQHSPCGSSPEGIRAAPDTCHDDKNFPRRCLRQPPVRCSRCSSHDGPGVKQPEHGGMPVALVRGFSNEWAGYVRGCATLPHCKRMGRCAGLIGDATVGRQRASRLREAALASFSVLELFGDTCCDATSCSLCWSSYAFCTWVQVARVT